MNDEARRPFTTGDVVLYAVGVVGLVACLTLLFLGMRAVMDIGGYCADGGPYEINQHCPEGIPLVMILGVFGLFGFGALMGWKGVAIGGVYAGLVLLAWPALFLSLGWNFLEYAFNPPGDESGIVWGWLIPGVLFVLMGGLPLLALLPERRPTKAPDSAELRRTRSRLVNAMAARADQRGWRVASNAPTRSGPQDDLVSKLERLSALRLNGTLTELEFEQAKRALLDAKAGG